MIYKFRNEIIMEYLFLRWCQKEWEHLNKSSWKLRGPEAKVTTFA